MCVTTDFVNFMIWVFKKSNHSKIIVMGKGIVNSQKF